MSDYHVCLRDLISQSRKKQPEIEKICQEISKSHRSDDINRLLELIVESHNRHLLLHGLRLIESIMVSATASRPLPEIDLESLMAYFDAICRAEDEQINLKLIQLLPKFITNERLSGLMFQKMLGYFLKFLISKNGQIQAACQNCLEHLFNVYFSNEKEDSLLIVQQLFFYLSSEGNSPLTQDTVLCLLLQTKIDLPETLSNKFVNIFVQNFPFGKNQKRLEYAFQITHMFPQCPSITKVLLMIQNCFLSIVNSITPANIRIVSLIEEEWFQDISMIETMFHHNKPALLIVQKICNFIQESLGLIGQLKAKNQSVPVYLVTLYDLVLKVRQAVDNYMEVSVIISNMAVLKPVKQQAVPKQKIQVVQYFLSRLGMTWSKIMVYLCKWGDYQRFKRIVYEQQSWITICGIFSLHKELNVFLKSLAYSTLPRKAKPLSQKPLKADQVVLGLLHRKVYILDLQSIIMILKIIQAIEKFFCKEQLDLKNESTELHVQIQKEMQLQYRVIRQSIKNLFHNSNELGQVHLGMFVQALTQVALDTFTKAQQPAMQLMSIESKAFSLNRMYTLASRNIGRINEFWSLVLNFLIVHIGNRQKQISQYGLRIAFKLFADMIKYQVKKQNSPKFTPIYSSLKQILASCQVSQQVIMLVAKEFLRLLSSYISFMISGFKQIFQILGILLDSKCLHKQLDENIQKCMDICMSQMVEEQSLPYFVDFAKLVVKVASHRSHQITIETFQQWKFFGGLVNNLYIMKIPPTNDNQCDTSRQQPEKIFSNLKKSSSEKKIPIQNSEEWTECFSEVMAMVIESFKRSNYFNKCHYLQLFGWTFLAHVDSLSYICIQDILIPTFNKIFIYISDHCLATDNSGLTPHFSGTNLRSNIELQNWKTLLSRYVNEVYLKIIEIVSFTYQNQQYKSKFKAGESILYALFLAINNSLIKRSYFICTTLLPIYCTVITDMPEVIGFLCINHMTALLPNILSVLTYVDQCDQIVIEQQSFLVELQKFIESTASLVEKYTSKLQEQYLQIICKVVGIYNSKKIEGLKQNTLKSVRNLDKQLIKSKKGSAIPEQLRSQFDKIQFLSKVSQKAESAKSIQEISSISTLSHIEDPVQLYKTILEVQPKMASGPIQFLSQTSNLSFENSEEQEEFIFKIVPFILTSPDKDTQFYRRQLEYISNYLIDSQNRKSVIESLYGVYTVQKAKQVYLLLRKLIKNFIENLLSKSSEQLSASKINDTVAVLTIIEDLKPPQSEKEHYKDQSFIMQVYPMLLTCLALNRPQVTAQIVKCLSQLTKLLPY